MPKNVQKENECTIAVYKSATVKPVADSGDVHSETILQHVTERQDSCRFRSVRSTGLAPIIKWPGGKEKELKYILPNLPEFDRYFEPFVGGGSVFMAIRARDMFINDFSRELMRLYENIAATDADFFGWVEVIDRSWVRAKVFFQANISLTELYLAYRQAALDDKELKAAVCRFCQEHRADILDIIERLGGLPCVLVKEMEKNLYRKMVRMRKIEFTKRELSDKDLRDNIETAIHSAVYMNYRYLYNNVSLAIENPKLHNALFFFIRNYAYSGMFRYSRRGEFNVPYGGMAYNSKQLVKKTDYYRSEPLLSHFERARFYNLDFEDFLRECNPAERDFVFLDPPYDSEFSTYDRNSFTKADQERLANFLINGCRAKWMMIIKNTDFIYGLYNKPGINIRMFDKEYVVSFMNRNNKSVTHLLITNY